MSRPRLRSFAAGPRLYLADHNADPKPFVWVKSADEIIDSILPVAVKLR